MRVVKVAEQQNAGGPHHYPTMATLVHAACTTLVLLGAAALVAAARRPPTSSRRGAQAGLAFDNGLALQPPLGWSTWQTCGDARCSHDVCTEGEVKAVATAMMENGMQALGYNHINLGKPLAACPFLGPRHGMWVRVRAAAPRACVPSDTCARCTWRPAQTTAGRGQSATAPTTRSHGT